jgi:hypothetical protein
MAVFCCQPPCTAIWELTGWSHRSDIIANKRMLLSEYAEYKAVSRFKRKYDADSSYQ